MLPFFCDLEFYLQAFDLSAHARKLHLLRRNWLPSGSIQLARRLGLHPVAQRLLRHAQFPGHHSKPLAVLDSLDGCHLEFRRVRLFRYLEHP